MGLGFPTERALLGLYMGIDLPSVDVDILNLIRSGAADSRRIQHTSCQYVKVNVEVEDAL